MRTQDGYDWPNEHPAPMAPYVCEPLVLPRPEDATDLYRQHYEALFAGKKEEAAWLKLRADYANLSHVNGMWVRPEAPEVLHHPV